LVQSITKLKHLYYVPFFVVLSFLAHDY